MVTAAVMMIGKNVTMYAQLKKMTRPFALPRTHACHWGSQKNPSDFSSDTTRLAFDRAVLSTSENTRLRVYMYAK